MLGLGDTSNKVVLFAVYRVSLLLATRLAPFCRTQSCLEPFSSQSPLRHRAFPKKRNCHDNLCLFGHRAELLDDGVDHRCFGGAFKLEAFFGKFESLSTMKRRSFSVFSEFWTLLRCQRWPSAGMCQLPISQVHLNTVLTHVEQLLVFEVTSNLE